MKVFEEAKIGEMVLQNRFVRSATWEGMATDDGHCTKQLTDLMVRLAKGGVGLIISSHTYVSEEGKAGMKQLALYDDKFIPALKEMTAKVHEASGKIIMQINHAGGRADNSATGAPTMGPMAGENDNGTTCREMTKADITATTKAFAAAAKRVQAAGFDGVQVHAAHGYLLSSYLSPYFNKRRDEYGGTVENRARFLLEVIQAVFSTVGDKFPVLVKMNAADFLEGGLTAADMVETALLLEKAGVAAIELSGGTFASGKFIPSRRGRLSPDEEVYYKAEAKKYKEKVSVPLILVGGIRTMAVAENLLQENICDFISMSRPLIREPELINRWEAGDISEATCISDNLCYRPIREGKGVYCLTEEREKEVKNKSK
jgi:2,4-dienoyl-CoA reductase-like NADH-dependent reductase (Old Yellow Enzyme family)